jgi:hypothetical protein
LLLGLDWRIALTANTPKDITTALTAMFNQALQVAHITN